MRSSLSRCVCFFLVWSAEVLLPASASADAEGDLLQKMDAHQEQLKKEREEGGVREHINALNQKHFGDNKLFSDKAAMEAHARKGMRNKLHAKRKDMYKDHKQHQTRVRNGEL